MNIFLKNTLRYGPPTKIIHACQSRLCIALLQCQGCNHCDNLKLTFGSFPFTFASLKALPFLQTQMPFHCRLLCSIGQHLLPQDCCFNRVQSLYISDDTLKAHLKYHIYTFSWLPYIFIVWLQPCRVAIEGISRRFQGVNTLFRMCVPTEGWMSTSILLESEHLQ